MSNRPIGQSHEPFSPQKKPYVWEDHSKRETSKIPIQSRDFEVWVNFLENFKSKLRQLRVLCLSSYKHFWDPLSTPDHIKKKNLWELNPLEIFFFTDFYFLTRDLKQPDVTVAILWEIPAILLLLWTLHGCRNIWYYRFNLIK